MQARVLSFQVAAARVVAGRTVKVPNRGGAGVVKLATPRDDVAQAATSTEVQADTSPGSRVADGMVPGQFAGLPRRIGPVPTSRPVPDPYSRDVAADGASLLPVTNFRFWRGASGQCYVHSAYTLTGCPDLPRSVCLLIRIGGKMRGAEPLAVLRLEHGADCANLARVRLIGATLGANEVHVHVLGDGAQQRRLIELDLRAGLLGRLHPDKPS